MKNKMFLLIGIGVLLLVIIVVLCIIFRPKKVEISQIKRLHFSYSQGYAIYSNIEYELEYKDSKYIATVKPYGVAEEYKREINVTEEFVKKVEDVLSENEVGSWDGFKKSDKNVLDGDSFGMYIDFVDGTSISANGYMSWPKNYSTVRNKLDDLFMGLYNSTY